MLIVEYFNGETLFYTDRVTGHVPQKGDYVIDPFTQQRLQVVDIPDFWVARQYVRVQVGPLA